jgi:hypothetical protein
MLPRNASTKDNVQNQCSQALKIRLAPRRYNRAISCVLNHTKVSGFHFANQKTMKGCFARFIEFRSEFGTTLTK